MNDNEASCNDDKKEEIRGLFVLGLLAVLASIRVQYGTMWLTIGQQSYNLILFLDSTIVLWSLYAFFMVLGLSKDVMGKTISEFSYEIGKAFLVFNFIALSFFGFLFALYAFPNRIAWVLVLTGAFGIFVLVNKIRKRKKKPFEINFKKAVISNLSPFLIMTLVLSTMVILLDTREEFVITAFTVGCIALIFWFILKLKTKDQNTNSE